MYERHPCPISIEVLDNLEQFRGAFVHLTPGFDWDPDDPIGDLLGSLELLFAENSGGYLSEPDFRDEVRGVAAVRASL